MVINYRLVIDDKCILERKKVTISADSQAERGRPTKPQSHRWRPGRSAAIEAERRGATRAAKTRARRSQDWAGR